MKAVLISIKPEWCNLILNGLKTVEIRKTFPRLQVPFKCYIYCTKPSTKDPRKLLEIHSDDKIYKANGKVVAEFWCKEFKSISNVATDSWDKLQGNAHEYEKRIVFHGAFLTEKELHEYAGGKNVYAWYISGITVYDKPKELWEFHAPIENHKYYHPPLRRPPQSWMYVEELEE